MGYRGFQPVSALPCAALILMLPREASGLKGCRVTLFRNVIQMIKWRFVLRPAGAPTCGKLVLERCNYYKSHGDLLFKWPRFRRLLVRNSVR